MSKDKPDAVRIRVQRKNQIDRERLGIVPITVRAPIEAKAAIQALAERLRIEHLQALAANPKAPDAARKLARSRLDKM